MGAMVSEATTSGTATGAATFTKWIVGEGPEMAGVVGGAVGEGVYAGRVLDMQMGPTTTVEALYGFQGSERAFRALVHVEQTGLEAVISGVVIDGWGKGPPGPGRVLRDPVRPRRRDHGLLAGFARDRRRQRQLTTDGRGPDLAPRPRQAPASAPRRSVRRRFSR